jgi:D-sedoheptulose 7-phosphate isomerase
MAAISLAADCVVITAAANDLGVEWIFARQVEALGLPGDVLIALSTSGKSPNILKAIEIAHSSGLLVIGFSGGNGMQAYCDVDLAVASTDTARIQEAHLQLIHKICQALDE